MAIASAVTLVPLTPAEAYELWTDVRRWPTFVDGFANPQRLDDAWPAAGAKLVWQSVPGGRGVVTEKVIRSVPATVHEAAVFEERLDGTQTVTFAEEEEGTRVELVLDYNVRVGGPLRPLVDALFIRRAQNDALRRTLRRFATEAAEQAAL
jgi:uncharacterized membrane protein